MATPGELLGRCRFPPPGTPVVCGVSGGADSLALLVLAVEAGCEVTAAHVDHGLRPGSEREAEVVAQAAEQLGARSWAVRISVPPGPNVEARRGRPGTRRCRRGRCSATPPTIAPRPCCSTCCGAPACTASARCGRTTATRSSASAGPRPALCAELGLHPVRDPSNDDPGLRRNRVRHEVLPLLAQVADRDVVPLLVRTADRAAEVADHLDDEAARLDPADVAGLAGAPPVVARAALRTWLRAADPGGQPPDAATLERALGVVRGAAVATDVGGGWRLRRRAGRLHLDPPSEGTAPDLAGP